MAVERILNSIKFAGDDKLEACAQFDKDHIGEDFSPTHPAVVKIQEALETIEGVNLSGEKGVFGRKTGDVVAAFKAKQSPPLLNFQGKIDRIVGIKTIKALDRKLPQEKPSPLIPVDPVKPGLPQDIFIYFRGAGPDKQGTADTEVEAGFKKAFNTPPYLATHQPVIPLCIFGGRDGSDKSEQVATRAQQIRKNSPQGITIVRGDSIGGLTALNCAAKLFKKGVTIDYIAIDDAAFFNENGEISTFSPLKFKVPSGIVAKRKENFFQTFGHGILVDSRGPGGFMQGSEFHGELDGFTNISTHTKGNTLLVIAAFGAVPGSIIPRLLPLRVRQPFASQAHEAAHKDADPLIDGVIKSLLKP